MKTIIGCGCSWTYGSVIKKDKDGIVINSTKIKDYVTILSEMTSSNIINLSYPGGSNYCISKQIEYAINLKPDLIIFNTTTVDRYDYLLSGRSLNNFPTLEDFNYYTSDVSNFKGNIISSTFRQISEKSNRLALNDALTTSGNSELIKLIVRFNNYYIDYDKNRLILNGTIRLLEKSNIPFICIDTQKFFSEVDVKNYISLDTEEYLKRFPLADDSGHWNEEGHLQLAHIIKNKFSFLLM